MVGVLADTGGRVLVGLRPAGAHQGGLWEFPGGKLEPGEAPFAGLCRELREELAIEVIAARPWLRLDHDYPDKRVHLDVWRVTAWQGEPLAGAASMLRWAGARELEGLRFPAANRAIVAALSPPGRAQ